MTVIEPNELLTKQTMQKIGLINYNITVISINEFLQYGSNSDVIIIDEYDSIMADSPYTVFNGTLNGVWSLASKKAIAFSATSQPEIERLVSNCIIKPKLLRFKSEYEMVHGTSPIQDGVI